MTVDCQSLSVKLKLKALRVGKAVKLEVGPVGAGEGNLRSRTCCPGPVWTRWGGVGCQRRGWEGVGAGAVRCQGWRAGVPSGCPEGFKRGSARAVTPGIGLAGLGEDWGGAQVDKAGGSGGAPV